MMRLGTTARTFRRKTMDRKLAILGLCLGVAGVALVWFHSGWEIALGVFLMIWGNNYERRSRG